MSRPCEEMEFCRKNYNSDVEMWDDIATFLRILANNQYLAVVVNDEFGVDVAFQRDSYSMSEHQPVWITEDELMCIQEFRLQREEGEF